MLKQELIIKDAKRIAHQEALFYEDMLRKEINEDRADYNKNH